MSMHWNYYYYYYYYYIVHCPVSQVQLCQMAASHCSVMTHAWSGLQ